MTQKAQHTPGSWWQFGITIGSTAGKRAICRLIDGPDTDAKEIELGSPNWDKAMADARLITAAPDLLAACERLITNLDNGKPLSGAFLNIRAAIAKAKGEQS